MIAKYIVVDFFRPDKCAATVDELQRPSTGKKKIPERRENKPNYKTNKKKGNRKSFETSAEKIKNIFNNEGKEYLKTSSKNMKNM